MLESRGRFAVVGGEGGRVVRSVEESVRDARSEERGGRAGEVVLEGEEKSAREDLRRMESSREGRWVVINGILRCLISRFVRGGCVRWM